MIPQIIHQTSKTREIPEKWEAYRKQVQALHPSWDCRLWTDEDNQAFVEKEFPEYCDLFCNFPKGIMRADVIRYMLMYRLGGFYMDLDYEMLKPFDLNEKLVVLPYSRQLSNGDECDRMGNAVFASQPNQPFWKLLLEDLAANPPSGDDVETATGPNFVTRVYQGLSEQQLSEFQIYTPDRIQFHPTTPRTAAERAQIAKTGQSYGIHHCHGTWREYGSAKKLYNKLKKTLEKF